MHELMLHIGWRTDMRMRPSVATEERLGEQRRAHQEVFLGKRVRLVVHEASAASGMGTAKAAVHCRR